MALVLAGGYCLRLLPVFLELERVAYPRGIWQCKTSRYLMPHSKVLVILPTYNEARNVEPLLAQIFAIGDTMPGWHFDVLVMDDTSPDGTARIVRRLADNQYPGRLFLQSGPKEGLGRALQRAFDEALKRDHDVVLTMDADFSHSPQDIPALMAAVDSGADVAVGSRYVEGGLIPGNWPLRLIIRTRLATAMAHWLGGVSHDLHELTTNFRAIRRPVLEAIPYNQIQANGYGIQIFLANAITDGPYKVAEVPITFRSRAHGNSKAKLGDVIEFLRIAYQLNPDSPAKQALRFVAVGTSGTIVNLLALWQFQKLTGSTLPYISLMAIQVSVIWNFLLHNLFTFREPSGRHHQSNVIMRFFKYEGAVLLSQTLMLGMYSLLTWFGLQFLVAQLIGIVTAFVVNYHLSITYIWNKPGDHAE